MYLAVLSARRAVEEAARLCGDAASTVFGPARGRGPDSRRGYGWEQLADGPLRPAPALDPCSCRRALWRGSRGSAALPRPLYTWPQRCSGHYAQAMSLTPSWPWTLSPTATGRSQPGRVIATPDKCCRRGSGRTCCGRQSTCCSPCSPAAPCWRATSGGCAPPWYPWGAFTAWGARSGRCLCGGPTCGGTCSSSSTTARSSGRAGYRPQGPAARTISWQGTCRAAREGQAWHARMKSCVRNAQGQWCGTAAPATGGGRQAGTMPQVPHPPEAAMRAMSASVAGSGALLRAASRGTPSGSGGGSGLVAGPVGVVGAPGAAKPPAKRPCVAPAPTVAGRRQDCRTPSPQARHGRVKSTLP